MPLFARPGTIIPFGSQDGQPDYEFTDGTQFRVYELADGAVSTCSVPTLRGEAGVTLTVSRRGQQIEASFDGKSTGNLQLQLVGIASVAGVEGGGWTKNPLGAVITLSSPDVRTLRIKL